MPLVLLGASTASLRLVRGTYEGTTHFPHAAPRTASSLECFGIPVLHDLSSVWTQPTAPISEGTQRSRVDCNFPPRQLALHARSSMPPPDVSTSEAGRARARPDLAWSGCSLTTGIGPGRAAARTRALVVRVSYCSAGDAQKALPLASPTQMPAARPSPEPVAVLDRVRVLIPEDSTNEIADILHEHLATDPSQLPVLSQELPPYQLVDVQVALDVWGDEVPDRSMEVIGISGEQRRHHPLSELVSGSGMFGVGIGPVDYVDLADFARFDPQLCPFWNVPRASR